MTPGPASYAPEKEFSKNNWKSGQKIVRQRRWSEAPCVTPGPGEYEHD